MEELKDLLSKLNATSSEDDIKKVFEKIAVILLLKSHIETSTGNYRILECIVIIVIIRLLWNEKI